MGTRRNRTTIGARSQGDVRRDRRPAAAGHVQTTRPEQVPGSQVRFLQAGELIAPRVSHYFERRDVDIQRVFNASIGSTEPLPSAWDLLVQTFRFTVSG